MICLECQAIQTANLIYLERYNAGDSARSHGNLKQRAAERGEGCATGAAPELGEFASA